MQPFIAITQRLTTIPNQEIRECLASDWGKFFTQYASAYLPLPLAYEIPFARYAPFIQGAILSGGNDLQRFCDDEVSAIRDSYEIDMINHCAQYQIPILGICHGAQIIAEYFACDIYKCSSHIGTHTIEIQNTSQNTIYKVNSFHNYCIRKLSPDLLPIALADDGSIEAFRHKTLPIFAAMWHVERDDGMNYVSIWHDFMRSINDKDTQ